MAVENPRERARRRIASWLESLDDRTQAAIARELGHTQSWVSKLASRGPRLEDTEQIAAAMHISMAELLGIDAGAGDKHQLPNRVVQFDPEEQRLLDAFRELGDEGRTAALVTLDSLAQHFPKTRQRRRRPAPPPKAAADDDL